MHVGGQNFEVIELSIWNLPIHISNISDYCIGEESLYIVETAPYKWEGTQMAGKAVEERIAIIDEKIAKK